MNQSKTLKKMATVENIDYIMKNVCQIPDCRINAAVSSIRSDEDCIRLMCLFSNSNCDFIIESCVLEEYKSVYNEKYSSKVNGMYDEVYVVMDNARKQLLFLYHLMNKFAKKPVQSNGFLQVATDNFEFVANHSMFGFRPIQLELFPDMNPIRKRLVEEIANFLNRLDENLQICKDVLMDEKAKREDLKELEYIFEKQINNTACYIKNFKRKCKTESKSYYDLLDYKNNPMVLPKFYHKITTAQLADIAYGIREKQLEKYTPLQRKVYTENATKIDKFIFIVTHVDSLFGKITGELLCYIYKYTECEKSHNSFRKCFAETYTSHGGKYKVVSAVALSQAFTNATSNDYEGYNAFRSKIDNSFLTQPLSSENSNSYQYSAVSQ